MPVNPSLRPDWKPIDESAVGIIYGSILVLSLLMALDETARATSRPAVFLFGSVLAVTLARAFAELLAGAIRTGERILTRRAWMAAWRQSHPTLTVANLPTLVMFTAGVGWLDFSVAVAVSQAFCIALLVVLGARVGWSIRPGTWLPLGGAAFAGAVGSALAALKYAIH